MRAFEENTVALNLLFVCAEVANMKFHELHRRALEATRRFFQAEAELLDLIQKIDACKGFRELGHTSLFSYAVGELKLSESVALNLINVARKAVQVLALKAEIQTGNLSVCKARKIVPVLNLQNQEEWIEKAKTLPIRKLEREIAKVAPQTAVPDRVRYVTESRIALTVSFDEITMKAIKRVQDLESQKKRRPVSLEETLAAMSACYIEKNDPVEKARRAVVKSAAIGKDSEVSKKDGAVKTGLEHADVTRQVNSRQRRENANNGSKTEKAVASAGTRRPINSTTAHAVILRDGAQCTAVDLRGVRCPNRRWIHMHHLKPVRLGGQNTLENLTTLCSAHHRMEHAGGASQSGSKMILHS